MWLNAFIEAQGKFAPSVQYPELEIAGDRVKSFGSEYAQRRQRFLMQRLNTSYQDPGG